MNYTGHGQKERLKYMLMRKRYRVILAAAAAAMAVVWGGVSLQAYKNNAKLQGKLVFANAFDQGHKINRIVITTAEDVTELKQENSYWRVVNKGNYYADFGLVHRFLSSANKSAYMIKLPYDAKLAKEKYLLNPEEEKEDSGLLIRTYIDNTLLDEVIIGLPDDEGRYFFARNVHSNEIWLINGDFNLPIMSEYWLLKPVLAVSQRIVEVLSVGDETVQREIENGPFFDDRKRIISAGPLLDVLGNVTIVNAMTAEQFKQAGFENLPSKVIRAVTFYGLEFICTAYMAEDSKVWLNIKLSTTPLPMAAVNDYIRDNRLLYDGWYFEISPEQQHILRDFRLI